MTETAPPIWLAPTASGPIDAAVVVPGSKSMTNRALVLRRRARRPTTVPQPALRARDTELMAAALVLSGQRRSTPTAADWVVTPSAWSGPADVDCGLAGTVMRFLPPVAALAHGPVAFDGDPHARKRPMGPVLDALRELGVTVDDGGRGGLPFTVVGAGRVRGGMVEVDASGVQPVRLRAAAGRVRGTTPASTSAASARRSRRSPTSR